MSNTHPERKNLLFYLDVVDLESNQVIGHLGDISLDGMLIISEQTLPLESRYHIHIKLPPDENLGAEVIDLQIETRWSKPDVNPTLQCIGCRFVEISPTNEDLIERVEAILGW